MFSDAEPRPDQLRLVMASEHIQVEKAVDHAESFVSAHIEDDDFVYRVALLTSEAVTNALEHGNSLDPDKKIIVEFSAEEDRIEVDVQDEGKGFNRTEVRDPLHTDNLLEDGGRGIYLIEMMADEVFYELDGRRVRMVFKRPES